MVSQHPDHLACRRGGHKPEHQLHLTGAEHRTLLLPRGAVEDVPPATSGSPGWAWNCWRRRRACPLGAQVNIPTEIRPDGVLNGLEIAPVRCGEHHRHGVNNQRSDSPYS